ncbi:MAG: flagellar hook-basal body complex protein FliE [Verrucomicrobiota bacterium]
MDPLSSLRFAVSPEMRAARMARPGDAAGPKAIPTAELQKLSGPQELQGGQSVQKPAGSFESTLGRMVSDVSAKQGAASDAVAGMMEGQDVSLHQAMIAMEEASVSFQLMVEVRNKLLDSYQELMRMQV